MENSISFTKSPVNSATVVMSLNQLETQWEKVTKLYKDKKYKESILNLIDYCNSDMRKAYGNESQSEFNFPHGSVIIGLKITDTEFIVNVPFLKIPQEASVPLLRKVSEANFDAFTLAQIVKRDDQLFIEYKTMLDLCEPTKIVDVLRNICVNADFFDDEFTTLFNTTRLKEPTVTPYDSDLAEKAWQLFNDMLQETEQYIKHYEVKRQPAFVWDMLAMFFYKLDYCIKPQGNLSNIIRKSVKELNNRQLHYADRVTIVKKTVNELKQLKQDVFTKDLYFVQDFIAWKHYGRLEKIQSYLEKPFDLATDEFNNGDYQGCTLTILQNYLSLLYYYKLTEEVQSFIVGTLEQASSKSWKEAAEILHNSAENLLEGNLLISFANNPVDFSQMMNVNGFDMNAYMAQAMQQFGNMFGKQ